MRVLEVFPACARERFQDGRRARIWFRVQSASSYTAKPDALPIPPAKVSRLAVFALFCCFAVGNVVPRGLAPRTLRLLAVRSDQLSYETLRCAPGKHEQRHPDPASCGALGWTSSKVRCGFVGEGLMSGASESSSVLSCVRREGRGKSLFI